MADSVFDARQDLGNFKDIFLKRVYKDLSFLLLISL